MKYIVKCVEWSSSTSFELEIENRTQLEIYEFWNEFRNLPEVQNVYSFPTFLSNKGVKWTYYKPDITLSRY